MRQGGALYIVGSVDVVWAVTSIKSLKKVVENDGLSIDIEVISQNVTLRDFSNPLDFKSPLNTTIPGKGPLKSHAILSSNFDQILLIDSDTYFLKSPLSLFDSLQNEKYGAIMWPDTVRSSIEGSRWFENGRCWIREWEFVGGLVVLDRSVVSKAVLLAGWMNLVEAKVFDDLTESDTDSLRLAMDVTSTPYHLTPYFPDLIGVFSPPTTMSGIPLRPHDALFCGHSILKYDVLGDALFIHMVWGRRYDPIRGFTPLEMPFQYLVRYGERYVEAGDGGRGGNESESLGEGGGGEKSFSYPGVVVMDPDSLERYPYCASFVDGYQIEVEEFSKRFPNINKSFVRTYKSTLLTSEKLNDGNPICKPPYQTPIQAPPIDALLFSPDGDSFYHHRRERSQLVRFLARMDDPNGVGDAELKVLEERRKARKRSKEELKFGAIYFGGSKDVNSVLSSASVLMESGFEYPVEMVAYEGRLEKFEVDVLLKHKIRVRFIPIPPMPQEVIQDLNLNHVGTPKAILSSGFDRVILMNPHTYVLRNPSHLFNSSRFGDGDSNKTV
ncbi:hypothetical protein HDU76_002099, partial [Blyttiomyces sp. JEL0837]